VARGELFRPLADLQRDVMKVELGAARGRLRGPRLQPSVGVSNKPLAARRRARRRDEYAGGGHRPGRLLVVTERLGYSKKVF
jgi:hypothetical protein